MYVRACTKGDIPENMNAVHVHKYGRSPRQFSVQECACCVDKAQIMPKALKDAYSLASQNDSIAY